MKDLLASVSYSFNSFYDTLNDQGKAVFSIILFLIVILCIILLISYIINIIKSKVRLEKIKKASSYEIKKEDNSLKQENKNSVKEETIEYEEKTEIMNIRDSIEKALKEDAPITLTNFEEDQEKTAIISIDELMEKAKELEIISDEENTGVNYLEKYNIKPSDVEEMVSNTTSNSKKQQEGEVKAFRVSQVISPIYGVKKEVINNK